MGHLVCTYDEFSADILENRIIVTTLRRLLLSGIEADRSERIRIILRTLQDVRTLDPKTIRWDTINTRGTTAYTTLMSVCRLVLDGMLPTEESGQHKMSMFLSDQALSRLYEKFLLGYFRREHPELKVSSPMIEWDLESGYDTFLPVMKSDIVLRQNGCTMIIDAKYYGNNMQENHGKRTIHSGNLYQIFTYVKNMASSGDEVSGMLLYATTDSPVQPNSNYVIGGSRIMVRTLDLDCEFRCIADHLDDIAAMIGNTDSTFSDPKFRVVR